MSYSLSLACGKNAEKTRKNLMKMVVPRNSREGNWTSTTAFTFPHLINIYIRDSIPQQATNKPMLRSGGLR